MKFHIHKDEKIMLNAFKYIGERFKQGNRFVVTVENRKRTIPQNAYYHGVVLATVAAESGHTVDEMHEYFKKKYLCEEVKEIFGKKMIKAKSTTKLKTDEFNLYIDQIRAEMAEYGIYIPDPKEG